MKGYKYIIIGLIIPFLSLQSIFAQETKDQPFKKTLRMEGRIMYDFTFLSAGDYTFSGNEFRRLRLAAKGNVSKRLSYSMDFDFTGGKIAYRNVYLKYTMPGKYGFLTMGSFEVPTGLDMLTSSKYITFIERALVVTTQYGKHNTGFEYTNQKLLDGKIGLQLAATFNGVSSVAHQDKSLGGGVNFIGRLVGKVFENKKKRQLIHLGINYENRRDDQENFGYKAFKTENNMGETTATPSVGKLENTSDIGFELAATFGSFSIQGEYEAGSIVTDVDVFKTKSYYGYISYFITGEHRPYKNGIFGRVKPKSEFMKGGLGAIELVARYSVMDLNDNLDVKGTDDNDYKIANITLGVNWHLNKYTRLMYNYVNGNHNDLAPISYDNKNLTGHLTRFQMDF